MSIKQVSIRVCDGCKKEITIGDNYFRIDASGDLISTNLAVNSAFKFVKNDYCSLDCFIKDIKATLNIE